MTTMKPINLSNLNQAHHAEPTDAMRQLLQQPSAPYLPRPIKTIAAEIFKKWPKVYYGAVPYLEAMLSLDTMRDNYGQDSAASVVNYFLANANTWRGEDARRIKKELNDLLKH